MLHGEMDKQIRFLDLCMSQETLRDQFGNMEYTRNWKVKVKRTTRLVSAVLYKEEVELTRRLFRRRLI